MTNHEEAGDDFDGVIASYWDLEDPEATRLAGEQLVSKGEALIAVGLHEEAIAAAEEAIVRLGCSSESLESDLFRSAVGALADGLLGKSAVLVSEARYDESIDLLNEVIARFEDNGSPGLRRAVALALSEKVRALVRAGRSDEAFEARDYMARYFGGEGVAVPELGRLTGA